MAAASELSRGRSTIRILPGPDGIRYAFYGDGVTLGPPTRLPTPSVDDNAALPAASMKAVASGRISPEGFYAAVHETDVLVAGAMRVVLYGGDYLMAGARGVGVATGHVLNSTVADPLGQGGTWRYDRFVLLIDVLDGAVTLGKGDGQLDLLVRHVSGSVSGEMALHGVQGSLTVDEEHAGAYAFAQVAGNVTIDADYGSASTWVVAGEASYAALDAKPVFGSRMASAGPGLAEAAAVSVLAIAASAVASFLRKGVAWRWVEAWKVKAWLLAPLAARLDQARLLASRPRRAILRFVEKHGVLPEHLILKEIAPRLKMSESSVRKHLAKLDDGGQLATIQKGRRKFVGPNHGVLGSRENQVALALACVEVGDAIAVTACAKPGVTQQGMVRSVREATGRQLSRAAVSKRVDEFIEFPDSGRPGARSVPGRGPEARPRPINLIRKERDGRFVRYWPTQALREAMAAKAAFAAFPRDGNW